MAQSRVGNRAPGADVLVTGDDDLLALDGTIPGLRLLRPRTLLDEIAPDGA